MSRTHPYLKGLAETRARVAGDIQRLLKAQQTLLERMNRIRQQGELCERQLLTISRLLPLRQEELHACDRLIVSFNAQVNPAHIKAIQAWQGRYRQRGGLRGTIAQVLRQAYPKALTSHVLEWEVRATCQLEFLTPQDRNAWFHNSLRGALKDLAAKDIIERLHRPVSSSTGHALWRWKPPAGAQTLSELTAQAEAAGIGTQQAPDEEPEAP